MIRSRQNERVKDMRRARRCKGDLALLEGPHLLREALAAGIPLRHVLATPAFLAQDVGQELAAALPAPPLTVEPRLLDQLADSDAPRGVVAVALLPRPGAAALPRRSDGVYLYADGVQDPGNLGALARVGEASGAAGLALAPGCAHPNHPRALRAAAGSLLRLPVARGVEPAALDEHLAPLAPRWLVLAPRGGRSLYDAELDGALVLAAGAEGPGVSAAVARRADAALTIPLAPPVESLNVTTAAAVTLFELRRRRLAAGPSTVSKIS
ncbi:MAG: RNA methyltransferase [Acidobacteria bacterium]|nr:MAG: RNA methyltransferase [Acidobacteriota bacterium]